MNSARRRDLQVSALVGAVVVLVVAVVAVTRTSGGEEPTEDLEQVLVRDDSRLLDEAGEDDPTLVEFLDFECESCRAAYPVVQDVREAFEGELNVVVRYFPLDGHHNSRNAAHAVEAAARQGELEAMYSAMFTTQEQWGESQEDLSDLFRSYAEEIGLDMERYDRDVDSESVAARVERDVQDGIEAGVTGTPTFFLDGEPMQIDTVQSFHDAVADAVER